MPFFYHLFLSHFSCIPIQLALQWWQGFKAAICFQFQILFISLCLFTFSSSLKVFVSLLRFCSSLLISSLFLPWQHLLPPFRWEKLAPPAMNAIPVCFVILALWMEIRALDALASSLLVRHPRSVSTIYNRLWFWVSQGEISSIILRCACIVQVKGLPFNRYSWLTTHNSFARYGEKSETGSFLLTPTNQEDTVTTQLNVSSHSLPSPSTSSAFIFPSLK